MNKCDFADAVRQMDNGLIDRLAATRLAEFALNVQKRNACPTCTLVAIMASNAIAMKEMIRVVYASEPEKAVEAATRFSSLWHMMCEEQIPGYREHCDEVIEQSEQMQERVRQKVSEALTNLKSSSDG